MTKAIITGVHGDFRRAGWQPSVRTLSAMACGLALAACAVGPDFKPPPAPAASRYTEVPAPAETASAPGVGGAAQRLVPGAGTSV